MSWDKFEEAFAEYKYGTSNFCHPVQL